MNTMSKRSATRIRTNATSVVRSQSGFRAVAAASLLGGDATTVTACDKKLAEAVLERHRA